MRVLIINEHIRGSVSGEQTLWSTLGAAIADSETFELSSRPESVTEYIASTQPAIVIYNSTLGKIDVPANTRSIVVLQDNFLLMSSVLQLSLVQRLKKLLGIQTFYQQAVAKQREALAAATKIVAVSEHVAHSYSVAAEIIPIGVDTDLFHPMAKPELRKKYDLPDTEVQIFVGSGHPVKGFSDLMLQIKNNPQIFYIVVLKDDTQISAPNVKVFRRVLQQQLAELYCCADRYIGTSKVETLWLAPLEAMMCNVPVSVTPVGIFYSWKPQNVSPRAEAIAAGLTSHVMISRWKELLTRLLPA